MTVLPALVISPDLHEKIALLYREMEAAYDRLAAEIGLSCSGCPDNCCDSYFFHHTYVEWTYLLRGLQAADRNTAVGIKKRAVQAVQEIERQRRQGHRPGIMCPVNDQGKCLLYAHRLMICRLHGVPASVTRRETEDRFPGCYRCQELKPDDRFMDRTVFYQRLAMLERELLAGQPAPLPRFRLTIAEMIAEPAWLAPVCERPRP